ncbi:alpha/beta hydrolase [Streptomyces sp. NPDC058773]|uniref:alpha/beta hydrolase n=1 Tax=Streptomyces sp. NPDC058773 TaxID=3346632 RepID=UPI00369DE9CF
MASRPRGSRSLRTLLAALVVTSVVLPVSGAARPAAVPAPAPRALAPLRDAGPGSLAGRYAVNRAGIRTAERMAEGHGDRARAHALREMARPERQFLFFDGRDGGRTTEVFGDLARAERIAVLVPGSDTSLDRYKRLLDGAVALQRELGGRSAVVAWLGYRTPSTVSPEVLTPRLAAEAAPGLRAFTGAVAALRPTARISVLCHSYAAVVCGRAAPGLEATDLVLFGSPGAGADSVAALHTRATVWAGRGDDDWIADVPHGQVHLPFGTVGLGADPVAPGFGARVFPAGPGGHSDYLRPGSVSLRNLARIVSGRAPSEGSRHA